MSSRSEISVLRMVPFSLFRERDLGIQVEVMMVRSAMSPEKVFEHRICCAMLIWLRRLGIRESLR